MEKYMDESLTFEERAKDLVSRMTTEEKVMQMTHTSPAIQRLGVPTYNWWSEALHGIARAGVATIFPQAIGLAAGFDEDLMQRIADAISTEGRARHHEAVRRGDRGIYKGLTFWSPNINLFRDPRWGRGQETYGEDPYLTGRIGSAFVRGIQGDDPKYLKASACAKHFAAHSGPENERHGFNAIVSKKDLWETYLPAFRALVIEAGVEAVMPAYNRTNGEPCCGSKTLLSDILRDKWHFKGHVDSDCWAIKDFHEAHMVTKTAPESAALALNAGTDLNCGNIFINLLIALKDGLVTEETIDRACVRVMLTRFKLGMFDDPSKVPFTRIPYSENDSPAHRELSYEAATKTMVLLKNNDGLLPLERKKIKSIAVIGPHADSRDALTGNFCGTASNLVTVVQGIRDAVSPGTRVHYAPGCHLYRDATEEWGEKDDRIAEAVSAALASDVAVVCLGLDWTIEGEQGETVKGYDGSDKRHLDYPGRQQYLLEMIQKTGKPVILVSFSGSALAIGWADEHIPAIVQAWYPGAEGGRAVAGLIFGDYSPSGKLPVTFYRTLEELPDFSDYSMKGRTYRYMLNEALYPFGFGLGYSKFEYGKIKLSSGSVKTGESLKCSVTVKNVGAVESEEKTQLYLKDLESSVDNPRWSLCGFKAISLKPGESAAAEFELTPRQMAIFDYEGNCVLEPGKFEIYIGGSQPDARSEKLTGVKVAKTGFEVTGTAVTLEP